MALTNGLSGRVVGSSAFIMRESCPGWTYTAPRAFKFQASKIFEEPLFVEIGL